MSLPSSQDFKQAKTEAKIFTKTIRMGENKERKMRQAEEER